MRSPSRPKTSGGPTAPLLRRPIQVEDFMRNPVWVWDLPFAPMTLSETVNAVSALVESRRPSFFITANTHYAMLTKKHPDLHAVNTRGLPRGRRCPPGLGVEVAGDAAARAGRGLGPDL